MSRARVDRGRERVARRLSSLALVAEPEDAAGVRFADYYTEAGLRRALSAYGVDDELARRGLADWRLRLERDDPFHHRLVLFVEDVDDAAKRIADLRIHLCRLAPAVAPDATFDVVVIEWLSMQNPRAAFTPERPRLPGQLRPGTGMGRLVHDLLVLMTRRLGRDALVVVPERAHLVELYLRAGWRFVDAAAAVPVRAALAAAGALPYAHRAWAIERGFVVDEATGAPWVYAPVEMLLPVSERLDEALAADDGVLARLARYVTGPDEPRLALDAAGFARSLVEDPIEGLAPSW